MNSKKLILIGAGGHAKACIEIIESSGDFSVALIVGQEQELGLNILGQTIKHTDDDLAILREEYEYAFIGIGQIHNPEPRKEMHSKLLNLGYQLPAVISKHAIVSKYAKIGAGSIVMNGAILNTGSIIGESVIVNSAALIEHDVIIGSHCHVSTRVTINGNSKIGEGTFIGSGTVVRHGIEIGDNTFIGMGSVITESLPSTTKFRK